MEDKKKKIKERVMTETERYNGRVALQITDGTVISIGKAVQSVSRLRRGIQKPSGVGSAEGGRDGPRFYPPPPHPPNHIDKAIMTPKTGGKVVTQNRNFTSNQLFISPSGTSELDCATTKIDTTERSI